VTIQVGNVQSSSPIPSDSPAPPDSIQSDTPLGSEELEIGRTQHTPVGNPFPPLHANAASYATTACA
jgi:hypothetical protein